MLSSSKSNTKPPSSRCQYSFYLSFRHCVPFCFIHLILNDLVPPSFTELTTILMPQVLGGNMLTSALVPSNCFLENYRSVTYIMDCLLSFGCKFSFHWISVLGDFRILQKLLLFFMKEI